jgi:ferrous iron transport protein A
MNLSQFKVGQQGIIRGYDDPLIAGRLMTMGLLPGKEVQLVRKSIMGECFYIQSETMVLAIRRREGEKIQIEE